MRQRKRPTPATLRDFAINHAWCQTVAIATCLIAWQQLVALDEGLARAEPKRLLYRLLHTPPPA